MRRHLLCVLCFAVLLLPACAENPMVTEPAGQAGLSSPEQADQLASVLVEEAGWSFETEDGSPGPDAVRPEVQAALRWMDRTPVTADVAHYQFDLRIGSGPHDVVRIHRVVKETRPRRPIRTDRTLFLLHGDCGPFAATYLPGVCCPSFPADFGIAAFLAQNDVDVWGMDMAYVLVPPQTEDFSFMQDWGLQREADELRIGMAVARFCRLLTGNDLAPLNLLGFCGGVSIGYTALNDETQLPRPLRSIGGYIQVEMSFGSVHEGWVQANCDWAAYCREKLDRGIYQEDWFMPLLADLARNDPEGESPIIPGFTNWQAALFAGAGPFWFADSHNHAGVWESGLPVGFQYVSVDHYLDICAASPPHQPLLYKYEVCAIDCGEEDLPYDDHVSQIEVPVLYVGAAGGFGPYCDHVLSLLGSDDIQRLDVRLLGPDEALLDYGHNDLFAGANAELLVWQPILEWVAAHGD